MAAKRFQFPEKVIISWYLKKKLSLKTVERYRVYDFKLGVIFRVI